MIKRITLSSVQIYEKDKEGKPLTYKAKDGTIKRYKRILIKSDDFEGTASGFIGGPADSKINWQAGMQVSIKLEKNGNYLNFTEPSGIDLLEEKIETLEEKVEKIIATLRNPTESTPIVSDSEESSETDAERFW